MVATLCSYESLFGPYHSQTLRLMVEVGAAYLERGQFEPGERLLQRATGDLERFFGRHHDARLRGLEILRNLAVSRGDLARARLLQQELLECKRTETVPVV
jgi:hypothetical protein